jgi:hypothetical protein
MALSPLNSCRIQVFGQTHNFLPQSDLSLIAYLRSKDPFNSINSAYELVVADQDGSNSRVVFPKGDMGLEAQEFAWSPSGEQIAVIYQGNLWIVDVQTDVAHQLTQDGGACQPDLEMI